MRKIIFWVFILSTMIFANKMQSQEIESYLYVRPQIKFGKIENGNSFLELEYLRIEYQLNEKIILEGDASTGFTGNRSDILRLNHNVNKIGMKATYKINDAVGVFLEGSFAQKIPGHSYDVSYFRNDTYQAVGINIMARKIKLK